MLSPREATEAGRAGRARDLTARRRGRAARPGRSRSAQGLLGEALGQLQTLGDGARELHAQRARRERREDRVAARRASGRDPRGCRDRRCRGPARRGSARTARTLARRCSIAAAPSLCTSSAGSAPAGQRHDAQLELALGREAGGAQHRLLPGAVGVEREQHGRRHPRELAHLLVGQRGAHQADGVAKARPGAGRSRRCSPRTGSSARPCAACARARSAP